MRERGYVAVAGGPLRTRARHVYAVRERIRFEKKRGDTTRPEAMHSGEESRERGHAAHVRALDTRVIFHGAVQQLARPFCLATTATAYILSLIHI